MFALCDAKTFYTSKIEVYVGKQPPGPYEASNSPIDIVKRLVKDIENSKRNLTTDNWYTSIPLADYLLHKKITVIGTLKKNKREIPTEFLPDKKKEIGSCIFGFQKNKTLVSYVPRKNKAVILLSTMHYDSKIDVGTRKPEIIMDYNYTKGGVDTVDKMCAAYSVSRITKRWPLVIFYTMMNIAGINAQVLYSYSKHNNTPKVRRLFLKTLAFDLMKEHLASRAQILCLPSDISSFLKMNYAVECTPDVYITPPPKRGTCFECGRKKNAATSMKCTKCMRFVCKVHSKKVIICKQCSNNDNDEK
jgi:Transposase IS4